MKKCICNWCTNKSPKLKAIQDALPTEELKKDFEYFVMSLMCTEEDLDVANSKLAGEWPDWEWIKEAKSERGFK